MNTVDQANYKRTILMRVEVGLVDRTTINLVSSSPCFNIVFGISYMCVRLACLDNFECAIASCHLD